MQYELIECNDQNKKLIKEERLDKYDYLISICCGAIGGLIDIFFVGSPGAESKLQNMTDKMTGELVKKFAKANGWSPEPGHENDLSSAIRRLEKVYDVNYDQRSSKEVNNLVEGMWAGNHHMKSLAHSPDMLGLFFSVLNQFTSTSTFVSNGKVVTIDTKSYELRGGNVIAKLFCGVVNWFGHLMSDVSGSTSSTKRGSGIVIPLFELFGLCRFGSFNTDNGRKNLAEIATAAFENGYDARFGMAMAIPVVLTDLLVRLCWSIRRYFQYHYELRECVPTSKHSSLRMMILIGNGTLCVMDGLDAAIRSGGNMLKFFMRLNLIAWLRLIKLVLKEVMIRLKICKEDMVKQLERINVQLDQFLEELKSVDMQAFEAENMKMREFNQILLTSCSNKEITELLYIELEYQGIELPFKNHSEFEQFMLDDNSKLIL